MGYRVKPRSKFTERSLFNWILKFRVIIVLRREAVHVFKELLLNLHWNKHMVC